MTTIFESPKPAEQLTKPVPPVAKTTHPVKPLTMYAIHPDGVRFETQEEAEEVILFLREHIIVNVPWIILAGILLAAPTILFPIAFAVLKIHLIVPAGYLIVGSLFWYLMTFGFILANFISWFFNIYIVTNQRIVDIDFLYLLYKQFSEAELSKIQDISFQTSGIIATIVNMGDVRIETAGEMPNLEFHNVPYPEKVVETIRGLMEGKDV